MDMRNATPSVQTDGGMDTRGEATPKPRKRKPYYNYKVLTNGFIRLLRIHDDTEVEIERAATGYTTGDIHISLESYPIVSCPDFVALSYTWGEPTHEPDSRYVTFTTEQRCFPLFCDGKVLRVTRNLRDALRRLRQGQLARNPVRSHLTPTLWAQAVEVWGTQTIYYWIDAICIDQDDLTERQKQVQMMGCIYANAVSCVVWLGEGEQLARGAFTSIRQLSAETTQYKDSVALSLKLKGILSQMTAETRAVIAALLCRSWFSRLWVLQEAVLPEKLLVLCGGMSTDMDNLVRVGSGLATPECFAILMGSSHRDPRQVWPNHIITSTAAVGALRSARMLSHIYSIRTLRGKGQQIDTLDIFRLAMQSKSADDKDRVYGVLGFSADLPSTTRRAGLDEDAGVPIDYTLSTESVYLSTTIQISKNLGNLEFLSLIGDSTTKKYKSLPSWCPDYSQDAIGTLLCPTGNEKSGHHTGSLWKSFSSGTLLQFSQPDGTIEVQGFRYDTISEITPSPRARSRSACSYLADLTSMASRLSSPSIPRSQILWRTVLEDQAGRSWPAPAAAGLLLPQMVFILIVLDGGGIWSRWPVSFSSSMSRTRETWRATLGEENAPETTKEDLSRLADAVACLRQLEPEQDAFLPTKRTFQALSSADHSPYAAYLEFERLFGKSREICQRARRTGLDISLDTLLKELSALEDGDVERDIVMSFSQATLLLASRVLTRHYFATTHSQLLGIGIREMDLSCEIWFLHGYKAPVILRSRGQGRYEFYGDAFVYGLMHGEPFSSKSDCERWENEATSIFLV